MATVPDTSENGSRCICGDCPSYSGEGGFYCARGASEKPVTKRGCVCGDCPVFQEHDLQDGYFCVAGAAE